MPVHELKSEVAPELIGRIEEALAELEEQRLMVLEDKPASRAWIVGYFDLPDAALAAWQQLAAVIGPDWNPEQPEVRELPDVDWKNSYKAHFKASRFGRLHWVPVWERETFVPPPGGEVLWLDPGMAFGTGNHETTRLCCERLAQFAAQRSASGRVIDAGCGSGILALSAAKLGFARIRGFDTDPEAIRISRENAELNGLAGKVDFYAGDLVSGLAGAVQAELVFANIQADVLMRFVDELCGAVAPGGQLVLSGILARELDEVRRKFAEKTGEWSVDSRVLGEWSDLCLTR